MVSITPIIHMAAAAIFPLCLAYAGFRDLYTMEIPNWVSVALFAAFFPTALAAGWSGDALLANFLAGAAVLGAGIVLFAAGVFGGGDAKLLAAATLWTGWGVLPAYLFLVALSGGVLALVLLAFRHLPLPARWTAIPWIQRLHRDRESIPYGVAIAAGGIILFPQLPVVARMAG